MTKQVRDVDYLLKFTKEDFERFVDEGQYTDQNVIDLWSEVIAEKERADIAELDLDRNYMWYLRANEKLQAAEAREKKLRETLEFIQGITAKAPAFTDSAYAHFEASETLASLYPKEEEVK